MPTYEIVYWELNRLARTIDAPSMEEAIAESEKLRAEHQWDDCQEDSEGTNGVEQVLLDGKEVYNAGTVAGMVPNPPQEETPNA